MSNPITDEQRRRMEDNRRRALELKALKSKTIEKTAVPIKQPFDNRSNLAASSSSKPVKQITGCSSLISKDRFKIDVQYHPKVIEIFKSFKGHQYDPASKTWNFGVPDHSKVMEALAQLKPAVCIGGLPTYVLQNVRKFGDKPETDADLSKVDAALLSALMPFQRVGVSFGVNKGGRVLIADDMGLGKTIQALGIAHYYYEEWPLLIVAPSSMRFQWRESIWQWIPSLNQGSIFVMESSKDDFKHQKVVIVSFDLLQRRHEELARCNFKVVIIDESHHLKNFKTARTKAALPILQNSKRAILLSGTPALSRPIELYCQLVAINKFFMTVNDFGIRYCNGKKTSFAWDYSGYSNMEELNIILAETMMLRRLKSEVMKQLPPKLRKLVILDPSKMQLSSKSFKAVKNAFNEAKESSASEAVKRGKLLEWYSETANVKLPAVSAYIKDLVESEKKFIVFAHHRSVIDGLSNDLDEAQCSYIRIDGSTSPEDRQYSVEQFQSREDIRVAVLSIMAANAGITLTAAGLVVFAELYWNPGILTQAEDRAHRIGQESSVVVEYLVAKGTSDDVLWPMVQSKLEVLNKAGLSKDNFHNAEATGFVTTKKTELTIYDYYSQDSQTEKAPVQEEGETQGMDDDGDDVLMQLFNV